MGNLDTKRGRQMVEWIAMNDNSGSGDDAEAISSYVTVAMLWHIYGVDRMIIARRIVQIRQQEGLLPDGIIIDAYPVDPKTGEIKL
jgi:hypothetical protein